MREIRTVGAKFACEGIMRWLAVGGLVWQQQGARVLCCTSPAQSNKVNEYACRTITMPWRLRPDCPRDQRVSIETSPQPRQGPSGAAFASSYRHRRPRHRPSVTACGIAPRNQQLSLRHARSYLLPDQTIPCTTCEKPLRSTCPNSPWTASQPPNLMTQTKSGLFGVVIIT